ncbi:uncharacterized protein LOC111337450 [Stylophora pistillata]|uniref:uncharacterized protein LOC111337450 n=1 Tax=Stylophora pistillata TaxID=50429 RepID=UPI000C040A3C|nr:uncharacterized protein LOC111337450 [Stylophora pistillata]XP_022799483.1 uncharacterized protein LOC111337450 [Stylophora pistillata]
MAAADNNKHNMNDGNRDESLESEGNNEGLLAVGSHAQNKSDDDSNLEENLARTAHRNELSEQSPKENELRCCSCEGQPNLTPNAAPEMVCRLCGKAIVRNRTQQGKFNRSHVNPTRTEETLLSVVPQSYSGHLPSLPSVSLEDEACSTSTQAASLTTVSSGSQRDKIPVINLCHHSVQHPSAGLTVVLFLFERTHHERKEKLFILYMIPKKDWQVYDTIRQSYVDEGTRQAYSTRQISFCVNNGRSQDFHTVFVREQIRISFQIEDHQRETFVTPVDARGRDFVFRVANIECESNNRVVPGAKSHFRVQYVGDSEDPCQQQGKITLAIDAETQCSLYFSIAFWVNLWLVNGN